MSTYEEVLSTIFEYLDYSRSRQIPYNTETYNLARMRRLCERLDNPQDHYPSVHIAGSKGKGSTTAMTAAILQSAGLSTGLYTSPHLHTFRERIQINGRLISQDEVIDLWDLAKPHVEALERTTTFEIITLMAFLHFNDPLVDWAVLEVGLGGRLDATNVVTPQGCAITSLSYEHTELLGDTLSQIAFEKAGIIKPGVPVVTGPQADEAMAVIARIANLKDAPLIRVGVDWHWRILEADSKGLVLTITGPEVILEECHIPLVGYHQAANATTAVALVYNLKDEGVNLSPEIVRRGLANTYWPGRLERLNDVPLIMADSAHNRESAERLQASLQLFSYRRLILLFGASADKDIAGMLEVLGTEADVVIATRSYHPRAADPADLASLARAILPHVTVHITESTDAALSQALDIAHEDDLILVTGSIFVVAATRESWYHLHPDSFPPDDWVRSSEPIDGTFAPMLPEPLKRTG